MAYRLRLQSLLLVSAITLAGLWWLSLRYYSECEFSSRASNFTHTGTFYSATIGIVWNPHDSSRYQFHASSIPVTSLHHQLRNSYVPMGQLGVGRFPVRGLGEGVGHFYYFLELPIWLLYIAFIGLAYWSEGFFMRRSSSAKEKALAEQVETQQPSPAALSAQ